MGNLSDRRRSSGSILMEMGRKMSITNMDIKPGQSFRAKSSRMTKFVEFWGADKPFANITDNKMAKTIAIAVCAEYFLSFVLLPFMKIPFQSIAMIESNLLPIERNLNLCQNVTMWYDDKNTERLYRQLPNARFKNDITCCFVLVFIMSAIQIITFKRYLKCGNY